MRPQLTFIAILGAVVLLAYLINTAGYRMLGPARSKVMQSTAPPGTFPKPQPPGVKAGSQLKWRTLVWKSPTLLDPSGCLGGLAVGHFTHGSGDEQLIIVRDHQTWLLDADGTRHVAKLHGRGFMMYLTAWDFDRDGVDDILPDASLYSIWSQHLGRGGAQPTSLNLPTATPVFSVSGTQLGTIPEVTIGRDWQVADFDRDGFAEITSFPTTMDNYGTAKVFGKSGNSAGSFMVGTRAFEGIAADIDGDGIPELVGLHAKPSRLTASSMKGSETALGTPPGPMSRPIYASDLGGGPGDELVFSEGIMDPQSGAFWPFSESPVDNSSGVAMYSAFSPPQVCDLPPLGGKIVVMPGALTDEHSELFMFDSQAKLVYHEVFPRRMFEVTSMSSQGKDYILLQFEDRILIYP